VLAFIISLSAFDKYVMFGGAILVFILLSETSWLTKMLETKSLRFLGDISYSLYLFHIPAMMLILFGLSFTTVSSFPPALVFVISAVTITPITILISYIFFTLIEKPGIHVGRRISSVICLVRHK
jgi:peptidoglycan/LPS O-acetylase OafA/YrhL